MFLTVPDVRGTYTVPYIQASPELAVAGDFPRGETEALPCRLLLDGAPVAEATLTPAAPRAVFAGLAPGEYVLETPLGMYRRIGIGTVLACLGDSLTEGYFSRGFMRGEDLTAADFPPEAVSRDGRNFPQFSPTTAVHQPDVSCWGSWMPELNDRLSASWDRPVLLANEGWGGISATAYLERMRTDANWQARMRLLQPRWWLIHLGVNDERASLPAAEVGASLEGMVDLLLAEYGAAPERIFLARPSYDYWPGAPELLSSYIARIDELVTRRGLRAGPDFFAAFAVDRARWYGEDPVHPGLAGMTYMAELWHAALLAAAPEGEIA